MRPKGFRAASTTLTAVSFLLTSPSTRTRSDEGLSSFDLLIVREVATTRQPRWSSACATPRPIPLEAPVTIATACWVVFIEVFLVEVVGFQHLKEPNQYCAR